MASKHKAAARKRKNDKFKARHGTTTRKEWAKQKKEGTAKWVEAKNNFIKVKR